MSWPRDLLLVVILLVLIPSGARAQGLDHATLSAIRDEGLRRSQVMQHVGSLSDVYGPRVTGTPAIEEAGEWAMNTLREWGLVDVRAERFAFGHGWSLVRFHAHLLEPQVMPIIGFPKSWSSSTEGTVVADVVRVEIRSDADFDLYRGTLDGKIVLVQPSRDVPMLTGKLVLRMDEAQLVEAGRTQVPPPASRDRRRPLARRQPQEGFNEQLQHFYRDEGVIAVLDRGRDQVVVAGGSGLRHQTQRTDGGTIFVGRGGPRDERAGEFVPAVTVAVEHYNRMVRLLATDVPVRMELRVETEFHPEVEAEEGLNGFNILAELPGGDLADEVVIIGAHFDTTHAGTGATDNAVGVSAMMEGMRILTAIEAKPRRTIRLALWGAEEQGLLGSRAYVRRHIGDPGTMELLPAHEKVVAYFNIDNGTGRLRGIWLQDNFAVAPIFESWISSMEDLGVSTIGPRSVSGTDHVSFDAVGIPAFQFMQDRLEYNSRTHHSNMDVFDRVQRDDVVQMAVVAASFAYNTAMRDEPLPRKPLPRPGE
ncbi:MAG: M20/M25/M40 family metallo-hydrolase [Acidobacteriota bacterium]|nr:M20/M25/M40 family metallo-hydrolase [Acidobacteriota bacterium]